MSSFTLKILACALMVVDHVAIIFFPTNPIMRLIGRLVFPPNFIISFSYIAEHAVSGLVQPFAVLAVPLIALYNGKRGPKRKISFLHLLSVTPRRPWPYQDVSGQMNYP